MRAGFAMIAVGAGAVWAINPDSTVSRLDPASGRRVAVIRDAERRGCDRGRRRGRVGDPGGNTISQIDPRTNRMRKAIELGSNRLFGIAVGGGAVWATSEEGVLWRVEPGQSPIERTIEVGAGVRHVAFGDGAAWVANWNDSTVSRVDPATNQVAARVPVGAAQALAAGAGSAWVSVAGGSRSGVLPASACGELVAGGRAPDVLIASDLTLRGPSDVVTARDGRRDPLRAPGPRLPGGRAHGRLPLVRRLDGAERWRRVPQVRRERQRVRGGRPARRGDRPVLLVLRADHDPDPQPGRGRTAGTGRGRRRRGRTSRAAGRSRCRRRTATAASPTSTTRPANATSCA